MTKHNKKTQLFTTIGIATASLVLIIQHYFNLPDFYYGAGMGTAIGISLLGIVTKMKREKG